MPEYVTIQLARPSETYSAGLIAEGWFEERNGVVQMTTQEGVALSGKMNCRPIGPGETGREVAVRLLRFKARAKPLNPFNRKLRYQKLGWL